MTAWKWIFGMPLLLFTGGCMHSHPDPMAGFRGMWKLDRYESFDSATGSWRDAPNRVGYTGYILYDGLGHMGVQLTPPGFKDHGTGTNTDSLNKEELRKALDFQVASFEYFGNCKITEEGNSIEHYRLSSNNPEEWGTTVKRGFEFRGDTLILTASESIGGHRSRLRWIKL